MKSKAIKIGFLLLLILSSKSFMGFYPVNEQPFVSGEKLVYIVHFGWLDAGSAAFFLKDSVFNGKHCYHAKAMASTIGIADKLFEVRDIYESFFSPDNSLPLMAIRNISEGSYRYYNEVTYHHTENKVVSQKSGEHEVPEGILDMLSTFYFFRKTIGNEINKIGDEITIDTFFGDEIFPMKMRYVGDEKIRTKLGKFYSMKFSPVVEPGRIFESEDDVTMWLSKDKNHIPLQVRIDLKVGSVKCDLTKYSGLQYPLEKIK
jgi:Protein of unknown function (DUF3108)